MKKDASGVVIHGNEKGKMLEPQALLCVHASEDTHFSFYDSMDTYAKMQRNDHYVYHNAVMTVAISSGCPASTATIECSPN